MLKFGFLCCDIGAFFVACFCDSNVFECMLGSSSYGSRFFAHFVFELDSNVSHMGHRILCKSFGIFFGFQIVVKFELAKVPFGFW